jgi:hypothetical protein
MLSHFNISCLFFESNLMLINSVLPGIPSNHFQKTYPTKILQTLLLTLLTYMSKPSSILFNCMPMNHYMSYITHVPLFL